MWEKEHIMKELKKQGKRMTRQRELLIDIILEGDWKCCKEVYYKASKKDPDIGMATVYRMMNTLEEIGAIGRCSSYLVRPRSCDCARENMGVSIVYSGKECPMRSQEIYKELKEILQGRGYLDDQEFAATITIEG